jgi:hypothetical protein
MAARFTKLLWTTFPRRVRRTQEPAPETEGKDRSREERSTDQVRRTG